MRRGDGCRDLKRPHKGGGSPGRLVAYATSQDELAVSVCAIRLIYALGLLLAPHRMNRLRLGPDTSDNPLATMTTRAFGAVHANIALTSLIALRNPGRRLGA